MFKASSRFVNELPENASGPGGVDVSLVFDDGDFIAAFSIRVFGF
jgi:hypothetical protein